MIGQQLEFKNVSYWLEHFDASNPNEIFTKLPETITGTIIQLYGSDFVFRETAKSFVYYEAHPEKKPKCLRHWSVALMRWLENASSKVQKCS